MEDSLENYLRLKRNTKEKEMTLERKKEILVTLQRRRECESRAVKIVEFLIEGKLQPEVFLRCLKHINQAYYQDVVEERAISKLCGYSLCDQQISDMPKKQFYINTKNNKVYDVTDRKNYCSNFCYKASIHIKQQVDNSPLWIRKFEDCPKFSLLSPDDRGIPGEEVGQPLAKPEADDKFTSISSFTAMSLQDLDEMEVKTKKGSRKVKSEPPMERLVEAEESVTEEQEAEDTNDKKTEHKKPPSVKSSNDNFIKPTKVKKNVISKDILKDIAKRMHEWITLETYVFLYGENKIRELLDNEQLQRHLQTLKEAEASAVQQRKYMELCKKLHMQQLADEKFDNTLVGSKLKPIPDYKTLKKESKAMDLKIHAFYSGVSYETDDPKKKVDKKPTELENEAPVMSEGPPAVLPLVDINSQTAIRRKIYLSAANKPVTNLAQNLGIPTNIVMDDLQLLVKTFKLQANNIIFKPAIWTLIALVLIRMLAIRDERLKDYLEEAQAQTFIKLLLSRFPNGDVTITELFKSIEDISLFLTGYMCENSDC